MIAACATGGGRRRRGGGVEALTVEVVECLGRDWRGGIYYVVVECFEFSDFLYKLTLGGGGVLEE